MDERDDEPEGAVLAVRVDGGAGDGPVGAHGPHLVLEGELDASTAHLVVPAVAALREQLGGGRVVRIDAGAVGFIDSAGIRALLEAHDRVGGDGLGLLVTPASPLVQRLLRLAGVPWLLQDGAREG